MKISFHGSVDEVTGSCFLVETEKGNVLIDCGMFQGDKFCDDKNHIPFDFDAKSIKAVFVTHPHADHTGRLPMLINRGFSGKIHMTEPCLALTKIVLEDAHKIMVENHKRLKHEVLYSREDLKSIFSRCEAVAYHQVMEPVEGVSVMLHEAGHVLGSAFISVEAEGKRVIFSGDIGNDNVPILPETEKISHADYVVCESTYGHRTHEDTKTRNAKLRKIIFDTVALGGVLMIPAFSIERTQELLYEINNMASDIKPSVPIFLDSPMAIRATSVYRHYENYLRFDSPILHEPDRDFFSFPNLRETLTTPESKLINDVAAPKIIIAGSGMMSGGRIMHHLMRYLPDEKNGLLIIGFQAHGTLGRKLYEGAKEVTIYGQKIEVRAKISAIGSFSAHGDMNKLTRWLKPEDNKIPKKVFLMHGEPEVKEIFATHLRHELGCEVVIPKFQESIEI